MDGYLLCLGVVSLLQIGANAVDPSKYCPQVEDAERYVFILGGSCYHIVVRPSRKLTFEYANADCEKRGGHLATIANNVTQHKLVTKLSDFDTHTILIGLKRDTGSTWKWVTGEPILFTYWKFGYERLPGNCAFMLLDEEGRWQPNQCADEAWYPGYLCEHSSARATVGSHISLTLVTSLTAMVTSLILASI